jgi:hypothetical protein
VTATEQGTPTVAPNVGSLRIISVRDARSTAPSYDTQDKTEEGADGPKKEDAGHRGFNGAVMRVSRKLRNEQITSDGGNKVADDAEQQSKSEASH